MKALTDRVDKQDCRGFVDELDTYGCAQTGQFSPPNSATSSPGNIESSPWIHRRAAHD